MFSYREKGLIGFGILLVACELALLYPLEFALKTGTLVFFLAFCWYATNLQRRARDRRDERLLRKLKQSLRSYG